MKILLHVCCANCALYPFQRLRDEGHEVFGFFFNPNIHPYQEYIKRLGAVKQIEEQLSIRIIYKDSYELEDFLRKVVFRETERCLVCYYYRMQATARIAREGKFDGFTTTLLGSKHQDHNRIKEIGLSVGKEYDVAFYYSDFRKGWREGMEMSKKMSLYRQQYCGCIYSEKERFCNKK